MKRFAKGPATAKSIPARELFTQARKKIPNRQRALPLEVQFFRKFLADRQNTFSWGIDWTAIWYLRFYSPDKPLGKLWPQGHFFHQKPFMGF